ncbi:hypothetical protein [Chitinophaga rhizophila]|uniref:Uncharacterized protein n=1 Tax=Chitinophaga rhizophila TaxID=2866212 RepID=A0ABS7GJ38_9BACT|nr:hypothetical protein [Chitinophaga rhizophila]MBW8687411.1 hypothetical protein [Chitinophaga rhizophila]
MQNYVVLPAEEAEAQKVFQDLLDQPDLLLLLILGDDEVAAEANDTANFIRSGIGSNGMGMYDMVMFVRVTQPQLLLPVLRKMEWHPRVKPSDYHNFVLLSVSPFRNIISEGVTRARFMKGRGSMHTAVMTAYANG